MPYMVLYRTLKHLQRPAFVVDVDRYQFLLAYTQALWDNGHHFVIDVDSVKFKRFGVIYQEGIHAFEAYATCGLEG